MASQANTPLSFCDDSQLVGLFMNWGLQGALTVQVYLYHTCFPRDSLSLKSLVYGILVYEWVQTGLATDFAFDNFVYGFGQRSALTAFHNTWFSVTIMCSVISAVVQCYFALRIWVLGRSRVLTGAVVFVSVSKFVLHLSGLRVVDPSAAAASAVTPVISAWLGGAAFVDVIIAISMTILLTRAKTGIRKSDNMVNRLIVLVVETGTITAAVAIADLVCFTAYSDTLLHECPAVVLAKLYANTFLASLNNRALMKISHINSVTGESGVSSVPMHGLRSRGGRGVNNDSVANGIGGPVRVTVDEETMVARDIIIQQGNDGALMCTGEEDGKMVDRDVKM
ncbi:hypothetical protein C8Q80DRAFT_1165165 [Daedaleopsis nitida]|nr:hypothetical protein C8Q80DRAFT_1165165 [Daedaleopsis nitida]